MSPVLRRIAIHGGLTAIVLGIIGLMFAEMASMWIVASVPPRGAAKATPPDTSAMKKRLPLIMAFSGFAFVALGELVLHQFRKNRIPPTREPAPTTEATEKLIQELLARVEAKAAEADKAVAPAPIPPQNSVAPTPPPSAN